MPLVHVHGIANRRGEDNDDDSYGNSKAKRDAYFRRFLHPEMGATPGEEIFDPYWGGAAGSLRWRGASIPRRTGRWLGPQEDDLAAEIQATEETTGEHTVLDVGRRDLRDAIDLLFLAGTAVHDPAEPADLAAAGERLVAYAESRDLGSFEYLAPAAQRRVSAEHVPWLAEVADDSEFVDRLWRESAGWQLENGLPAFTGAADQPTLGHGRGALDMLYNALRRFRRRADAAPTEAVARILRRGMRGNVAPLVGDVTHYLAHRGEADAPGEIVSIVADALERAAATRGPGRPLVVVTHSMGGNIVFDIVTHYRPAIEIDVLLTVGGQVGLFQELGLFRSPALAVPAPGPSNETPPRTPRPENVKAWLNVVDMADPLAFLAEPIFTGAVDYLYPSAATWAHGAYFRQPYFHARLAGQVRKLVP
jgi:hypothetical protein